MHDFVISILTIIYQSKNSSDERLGCFSEEFVIIDMSYLLKRYTTLVGITELSKEIITLEINRSKTQLELNKNNDHEETYNKLNLDGHQSVLKNIEETRLKLDLEWSDILKNRAFLPIACDDFKKYIENVELYNKSSTLINCNGYYIPELNEIEYEYIKNAVNKAKTPLEVIGNIYNLFIGDDFELKNVAIFYFEERHGKNILLTNSYLTAELLEKLQASEVFYETDQHWLVSNEWVDNNIELLTKNFKLIFNSKLNICCCYADVFVNEDTLDYENSPKKIEFKENTQNSNNNKYKFSSIKPLPVAIRKSEDWALEALKEQGISASRRSIEIWNYSKERLETSQKEIGIFCFDPLERKTIEFYCTHSLIKFKKQGRKDHEFAIIETKSNSVIAHSPFNDHYYMQALVNLFTNGLKTIGLTDCFNYIDQKD